MISTAEMRKIHAEAKERVENGRQHYDRIAGTLFIRGGDMNYHISRPADQDGFQLIVHTNMHDYNDPIPVIKTIEMLMARLQQLKHSFVMAWEKEMTKDVPKVTLEDQIDKLEFDYKESRERQKRFAEIAIPLFSQLWNDNVRGPYQRLRAFGVCHQDLAELSKASFADGFDDRGGFNQLMFKGVPIVQDDRAMLGYAVPIYQYGHSNIANINFKPDPIGLNDIDRLQHRINDICDKLLAESDSEPVKQQFCGKGDHAKNCRCHEGWRIKK